MYVLKSLLSLCVLDIAKPVSQDSNLVSNHFLGCRKAQISLLLIKITDSYEIWFILLILQNLVQILPEQLMFYAVYLLYGMDSSSSYLYYKNDLNQGSETPDSLTTVRDFIYGIILIFL